VLTDNHTALANKTRKHTDDLRGASRLAVDATKEVTNLVEAMHRTVASGPDVLGRPLALPFRLFTAPVYASIRAVTDLVGAGLDVALAQLEPLLGESASGAERDALLAVLNGVIGDHLSETGNPLAIEMRMRHQGEALEIAREELAAAFPSAGGKLLVLVHGCCANDRQWNRRGHDHGAALARDLGYLPLYLHYNSGCHISTNGASFAELLERLAREWPAPLDELTLLGHSMGGLVSRAACHTAEAADHLWRRKLRALVCVGSPHHGAPLERGGQWVQTLLGISRYSAPFARLGRIRSAGVTDMRFGNVLDEHWQGRDRFDHHDDPRLLLKLPDGVECYAIAATTATGPGDKLPGDGLVPVDSALGRHPRPELSLAFPEDHRWIGFGMNHLDLLDREDVYAAIKTWLSH
jgi:pimeloyl-ACP methyl ester carboxylesterase